MIVKLLFLLSSALAETHPSFQPLDLNFDKNGYMAVAFANDSFAALRAKARKLHHGNLLDRGESHLTLLTPPEYMRLGVPLRTQLLTEFKKLDWKHPKISVFCLGRGTAELKGQHESTYFLVVDAPEVARVREKFGLSGFYPHVTLGFSRRDLHIEDGVKKDHSACLKD